MELRVSQLYQQRGSMVGPSVHSTDVHRAKSKRPRGSRSPDSHLTCFQHHVQTPSHLTCFQQHVQTPSHLSQHLTVLRLLLWPV
ncbi:unnamed protein product [Arctogadus glacialis]